jgi:hypothetical protein
MTTAATPPPRKRRLLRWFLKALAALVIIVALFYAEEDWRGKAAWESCQRDLKAKGMRLDWADFIPPSVPDNENIFGVPQMQKWFVGKGSNELTDKLHYPGWDNPARIVVANLVIGLADATPPTTNFTEIQWEDTKAQPQTARLIRLAIGPVVVDPSGPFYTARPAEAIQPAQVFLRCQTRPEKKDLDNFIPTVLVSPEGASYEQVRVEAGSNDTSYNVTMRSPSTVSNFLQWNEQLEPEFTLMSDALQRPDARIPGNYEEPSEMPAPNFMAVSSMTHNLGARARCHLALGQFEKAVDELGFMRQVARLLEAAPSGKPMPLATAMMDVAVTDVYLNIVEDGLRLRLWREPQLAELEEQLKKINLHPFVANAVLEESAGLCHLVETDPQKLFNATWSKRRAPVLYHTVPQGWIYQNMVVYANLQQHLAEGFLPVDQAIVPNKIDTATQEADTIKNAQDWSPFRYLAVTPIPNLARAGKGLVSTQTMANQAQIVCALDLFRLVEGGYPETLAALAPRFIDSVPNDIVGGQPPHYHRDPDGTFQLYSIGWDEMDHLGLGGLDLIWASK